MNPRAAGGRALKKLESFREGTPELADGELFVLSSLEALGSELESLLSRGYDEWVLVGGDGSNQRILCALDRFIRSGRTLPALALLPMGTGSDYFRTLSQGPNGAVPAKALLETGAHRGVDYGRVAFGDSGEAACFLNMCSIGFSAEIARRKEQMPPWVPSSLIYVLPTLKAAFEYEPAQVELRFQGGEWAGTVWAVFVSKGQYAGGGMRFAQEVELDDGSFEVTWVGERSALSLLGKLPELYGPGLRAQSGVFKARSSWVEIRSPRKLLLELDGEVSGETPARIDLVPAGPVRIRAAR